MRIRTRRSVEQRREARGLCPASDADYEPLRLLALGSRGRLRPGSPSRRQLSRLPDHLLKLLKMFDGSVDQAITATLERDGAGSRVVPRARRDPATTASSNESQGFAVAEGHSVRDAVTPTDCKTGHAAAEHQHRLPRFARERPHTSPTPEAPFVSGLTNVLQQDRRCQIVNNAAPVAGLLFPQVVGGFPLLGAATTGDLLR